MGIFNTCKTTIDSQRVKDVLLRLETASSFSSEMFKTLLNELEIKWSFDRRKVHCYVEGSLEALLHSHTLFTAVQEADPKVYTDISLLLKWCKEYCQLAHGDRRGIQVKTRINTDALPLLCTENNDNLCPDTREDFNESDIDNDSIYLDNIAKLLNVTNLEKHNQQTENEENNKSFKEINDDINSEIPSDDAASTSTIEYYTPNLTQTTIDSIQDGEKDNLLDVESVKNLSSNSNKIFKAKSRKAIKHKDKVSYYQQIKMSGRFKCDKCGKAFGHMSALHKHMTIHSKEKKFACDSCDRKFYVANHLRLHSRVHQKRKASAKPPKPSIEETLGDLANHMAVYERTPVVSDKNYDTFKNEFGESFDSLNIGKDGTINKDVNNTVEPAFSVNSDPQTKTESPVKPIDLMTKQRLDSGLYLYKCKECSYTNTSHDTKTMKDHIKRKHLQTGSLSCPICGKRYAIAKDLNRHVKSHTQFFGCTLCDKKYESKTALTRHMMGTHSGITQHRPVCNTCGKDFCNNTALKYHNEREHLGTAKSFICELCGIMLQTAGSHKRHMSLHIEPPRREHFPCEICGTILGSKVSLTYHIQAMHSEERNFSCHLCGQAFKVRSVYRNHMKTHEDREKYKCSTCDKSLVTKQSLKNHILTHTGGNRTFVCEASDCNKSFCGSRAFKKHMLKKHNMKPVPGKRGRPQRVSRYFNNTNSKEEKEDKTNIEMQILSINENSNKLPNFVEDSHETKASGNVLQSDNFLIIDE